MSYLDPPNLHFYGQFWTDPSTINNATENYDLQEVQLHHCHDSLCERVMV
jgi:hypothetical protein